MFRKASFGFTAQAGLNRAKSEAGKIGWACNKQHRGAVMRASSQGLLSGPLEGALSFIEGEG